MYLTLPFPCSHPSLSSTRPFPPALSLPLRRPCRLAAFRHGRFQPLPSDDEPPEIPEDTSHGLSRRQIFERQVDRARRRIEAENLNFPALDPSSSDDGGALKNPSLSPSADLFLDVDQAIYQKQEDLVKAAAPAPAPALAVQEAPTEDELTPDEEQDLNEINNLQAQARDLYSSDNEGEDNNLTSPSINGSMPSFGFNFDVFGKERIRVIEPKFSMTLAELLDESKVVPVLVNGDLEVSITGVQTDPREVTSGDLFICSVNSNESSGIAPLTEADKRGAVAVVADKEINIDEKLACRAVVIVEDTVGVIANLAAAFYGHPSEKMPVIGVAGSSGVTATVHLIRAMYEASGRRTGMLSVVGHYVHSNTHLESPDAKPTIPDSVSVQKMLAKMIFNGSEAVAMDSSIDGNGDLIDYDIAVFTNLRYDDAGGSDSREEYIKSKARVFTKMVDPSRHRKVVNIDDPNVLYFLSQGSPDVPVVTYAMENKKADVHVIKHRLSLFETEVLVQTPNGILEISSGLLCRENVYSILAAVAVGVAVGVPLEDIVRGIEEVDAVPGRIELIDEEQAFGVVVDHARTPEALTRLLDTVKELGPRRIITGLLFANLFFRYHFLVRNDI